MSRASQDWQRSSVFRNVYNSGQFDSLTAQCNLELSCKDSSDFVRRMGLLRKLNVHEGCVNSLHWSSTGEYVLSGSDDQYIAITNPHTNRVLLKYKTAHNVNIFSCRFMPYTNDHAVISCSGDGVVLHTEFLAPYAHRFTKASSIDDYVTERNEQDVHENYFSCHKNGTAYDVLPLTNEPRCFLSCGEDGTVRFYDLRCISRCNERHCRRNMLVVSPSAVNAMDVAPINHQMLAVGCADSIVRVYDRRKLAVVNDVNSIVSEQTLPLKSYPIPAPAERRLYRTTCVKFSPDETELLVSYSSDYLYLYDMRHEGFDALKLFATGKYMTKMPRSHRCISGIGASGASGGTSGGRAGPRLRLRGDWSDTGPNARPEAETRERLAIGQVRPPLQANVMGRIADVISRMLSDPSMRMGLSSIDNESPVLALTSAGGNVAGTSSAMVIPPLSPPPPRRYPESTNRWRRAIRHTIGGLVPASSTTTIQNETLQAASTARGVAAATSAESTTNEVSAGTTTSQAGLAAIKQPVNDASMSEEESNESVSVTPPIVASTNDTMPMDIDIATPSPLANEPSLRGAGMKWTANYLGLSENPQQQQQEEDQSYVRMKFCGHRNSRTMIKSACFWGHRYVMSGSDCGHIFVWERQTGKLVKLLEADYHVVNRVMPHPHLPYLISSGIDYDIKLWAPVDHDSQFDQGAADIIMQRNAIMLQETMDTVTVPASMLIRLLTGIHSLRNRNRELFMRRSTTDDVFNTSGNASSAGPGTDADADADADGNSP